MQKKWNQELFRRIIEKYKEDRLPLGMHSVSTKKEIYKYLANKLHVSTHAIEKWKRVNNNGPSDPEIVKRLEEILGVSLTCEVDTPSQKKEDAVMYSTFVKENIFACYKLMKDYLYSEDIENEDVYCAMRNEIRMRRIALPQNVYDKVEYIADKILEPIIYDKNFFESLHTPDIGQFNDEGVFQIDSEENVIKLLSKFFEIIFRIEQELDDYFTKEFHAILIN